MHSRRTATRVKGLNRKRKSFDELIQMELKVNHLPTELESNCTLLQLEGQPKTKRMEVVPRILTNFVP
jgi:hypothetical protein